jgi:hypothetical protein
MEFLHTKHAYSDQLTFDFPFKKKIIDIRYISHLHFIIDSIEYV